MSITVPHHAAIHAEVSARLAAERALRNYDGDPRGVGYLYAVWSVGLWGFCLDMLGDQRLLDQAPPGATPGGGGATGRNPAPGVTAGTTSRGDALASVSPAPNLPHP